MKQRTKETPGVSGVGVGGVSNRSVFEFGRCYRYDLLTGRPTPPEVWRHHCSVESLQGLSGTDGADFISEDAVFIQDIFFVLSPFNSRSTFQCNCHCPKQPYESKHIPRYSRGSAWVLAPNVCFYFERESVLVLWIFSFFGLCFFSSLSVKVQYLDNCFSSILSKHSS